MVLICSFTACASTFCSEFGMSSRPKDSASECCARFSKRSLVNTEATAGIPAVARWSPSPVMMHLLTSGGPLVICSVVGEPKTCRLLIITLTGNVPLCCDVHFSV